ncbi:PAS domain-containing protein [Pelagibius litoralis]|uniref:PAS domain-containing protein n=1 Tax=Pelagibius litoralis TaxID=374515 RepID=A0A967EWJ2_9PROT|nr:PAS domain-containing protein [Pelagibius litoralis]
MPDNKLQRLFAYWQKLCRDERMPSRRDIDPVEIPDLLPNIFLLDVVGDGEDFVFRLAGTLVEDAFSMTLHGKSIAEIQRQAGSTGIPDAHHIEVARGGGPRYQEGNMPVAGREHWMIHRLLLPLASDGETVDVLMGGAIFLLGGQESDRTAEPWQTAQQVNKVQSKH